jgi:hypothetical protein
MPIYCYINKKGEVIEQVHPVGKAPKSVTVDGVTYKRYYLAESVSVPASAGWPLTCYASGVHPSQADELRRHFDKVGVPTEVTPDGDPVYRNAAHRRKALKARGFVDRSSFI